MVRVFCKRRQARNVGKLLLRRRLRRPSAKVRRHRTQCVDHPLAVCIRFHEVVNRTRIGRLALHLLAVSGADVPQNLPHGTRFEKLPAILSVGRNHGLKGRGVARKFSEGVGFGPRRFALEHSRRGSREPLTQRRRYPDLLRGHLHLRVKSARCLFGILVSHKLSDKPPPTRRHHKPRNRVRPGFQRIFVGIARLANELWQVEPNGFSPGQVLKRRFSLCLYRVVSGWDIRAADNRGTLAQECRQSSIFVGRCINIFVYVVFQVTILFLYTPAQPPSTCIRLDRAPITQQLVRCGVSQPLMGIITTRVRRQPRLAPRQHRHDLPVGSFFF